MSVPFYSYNPPKTSTSNSSTAQVKLKDLHPTYDSLTQTLAPSALDLASTAGVDATSTANGMTLPQKGEVLTSPLPTTETSLGFDAGFEELLGNSQGVGKADAGQSFNTLGGGSCTPGTERDLWTNFIDGNAWEDAVP